MSGEITMLKNGDIDENFCKTVLFSLADFTAHQRVLRGLSVRIGPLVWKHCTTKCGFYNFYAKPFICTEAYSKPNEQGQGGRKKKQCCPTFVKYRV